MSPKTGRCMQLALNSTAWRTPSQFLTGCGAFQRNSPTGGAVNGIPRKMRIPEGLLTPSITPFAVLTRAAVGAPRAAITGSKLATVQMLILLIAFMIRKSFGPIILQSTDVSSNVMQPGSG